MADKKSFILYKSWGPMIEAMPAEKAGELIQAVFAYQSGKEISIDDPMVAAVFAMIKATMEADEDKYKAECAKRSENGRKGADATNGKKSASADSESAKAGKSRQVPASADSESAKSADKDTDKDIESDKDTESDTEKDSERERDTEKVRSVVADYNDTCVSLPHVKEITPARRKTIKARLRQHSPDELHSAFVKVEASDFLKGSGKNSFRASFDWIMKDANLTKILEGNYDNWGTDAEYDSNSFLLDIINGGSP